MFPFIILKKYNHTKTATMVSYLVPVDGSANAKAAFFTCISMMNKSRDKLFLLAVVKEMDTSYGIGEFQNLFSTRTADQERKKLSGILKEYSALANSFGVSTL